MSARGAWRGRARTALVAAIACALLGALATAPAPVDAAAEPDIGALKKKAAKKTIKAVKKKLPRERTPGLAPAEVPVKVKVSSCKERRKRGELAGFKCRWSAKGELPGRVLLRCNGTAKVDARARKAKVKRCKNIEEIQAPLLATPHDVAFGYFEDFTTIPDLYDDLAASGANILREGITWKVLQPVPGSDPATWDWANFDAVYNQALALGLRPIFTFRNAPCWAAPAPCDPEGPNPPDPAFVDEYAFAAAEIAKRYPQLFAIEIWFEPNSGNFWGLDPDPAGFSALVGAAADAIHATGTGVQVYSGGLAPGMADPEKIEYGAFLSQALDAGGIERADAIAFHAVTEVPFQPGQDPTESYLGRLRIQTQSLRAALASHGITKPIVFTQLSYSTGAATYPYTEAQQAEALVASLELIRRTPDTAAVIVSRLLDNGDGSKVQGFGVLRADRTRKPAYCGLAAARGVATPPGC